MYFYCTEKVGNYYKVGISRSFDGIKNRLSDYRQISPKTNIKFFTEVPSSSIEDSFKNKFNHFRIGNSECYTLRKDIIFKHVLKFIHKDIQLFGFWYFDRYLTGTWLVPLQTCCSLGSQHYLKDASLYVIYKHICIHYTNIPSVGDMRWGDRTYYNF